ncbi:tRNA (adenosine(37)-N6)-threonylcarbamoyltransferase complex dimerization subunit type 1 TsaB [Sandaracinobacter sp. RS1-74]|uniref:tRNA (adenosine(37)-N6)-threonylcarbamoyltransferase complex dimerization subunit type 1 TsaB n=1 Tax=Sandaracinobacteroides sayramensis TaxID=2913411 RepID=UPI001EDAB6A8|nr:tRNA (adenosine(37)-N6)-threonylcarbamoyltransferase complex dimerization subunit type 1 TsaB [Sandaracinobacteroides sayramensis]MCG2840111.1 tRNA (adenosine(37)-N6)-threonylcarbamoyltransferase complex dimerization subunit type 1 TsaB [Sandaracinobacteroides sayramensis]
MPDRLSGRTLVVATGHDLSLALIEDGKLLAESNRAMDRGHAEAVVPTIAALLSPFGGSGVRCERVVVETGPGSFTGLRVGLAAATALALAWKAELRGIRSTRLVAAELRARGRMEPLLVALGAPRGQVWVEAFAGGGLESLGEPEALATEAARLRGAAFPLVVGSAGFLTDGDALFAPRAAAVASLAATDLEKAELLYVRAADPVAA